MIHMELTTLSNTTNSNISESESSQPNNLNEAIHSVSQRSSASTSINNQSQITANLASYSDSKQLDTVKIQLNSEANYLYALPQEVRQQIFSELEYDNLKQAKLISKTVYEDIKSCTFLEPKIFFDLYPSDFQKQFRTLIDKKSKADIKVWFKQFTNDEKKIEIILKYHNSRYFSERVFFSGHDLMKSVRYLAIKDLAFIDNKKESINTAFSPDGSHAFSLTERGKVQILSFDPSGTLYQKTEFTYHEPNDGLLFDVRAEFSSDSQHLVIGSNGEPRKIFIYDYESESGKWVDKATIKNKRFAQFSTNGQYLLAGTDNNSAKIYRYDQNRQWNEELECKHNEIVVSGTFSPDDNIAVTASYDQTIKIHQRNDRGQWIVANTIQHDDKVYNVIFSSNSRYMATRTQNGNIRLFGFDKKGKLGAEELSIRDAHIHEVVFSDDNRHLVTTSFDVSTIYSRNKHNQWIENKTVTMDAYKILGATFSSDCRHMIVTNGNQSKIYTRDANDKWIQTEHIKPKHEKGHLESTFSPDSRFIVVTEGEIVAPEAVTLYRYDNNKKWIKDISFAQRSPISSSLFSPDGRLLVTSGYRDYGSKGYIKIHGLDKHDKWVEKAKIETDIVYKSVTISPDGRYLLGKPEISNFNTIICKLEKGDQSLSLDMVQ